jgi:hypothetical protein
MRVRRNCTSTVLRVLGHRDFRCRQGPEELYLVWQPVWAGHGGSQEPFAVQPPRIVITSTFAVLCFNGVGGGRFARCVRVQPWNTPHITDNPQIPTCNKRGLGLWRGDRGMHSCVRGHACVHACVHVRVHVCVHACFRADRPTSS